MILLQREGVCLRYYSGRNFKSFVSKQATKIAVPKLLACQLMTALVQLRSCWVCSPACPVLSNPRAVLPPGLGQVSRAGERPGAVPSPATHSLLVLVLPLLPASVLIPSAGTTMLTKGQLGCFGAAPLGIVGIGDAERK